AIRRLPEEVQHVPEVGIVSDGPVHHVLPNDHRIRNGATAAEVLGRVRSGIALVKAVRIMLERPRVANIERIAAPLRGAGCPNREALWHRWNPTGVDHDQGRVAGSGEIGAKIARRVEAFSGEKGYLGWNRAGELPDRIAACRQGE